MRREAIKRGSDGVLVMLTVPFPGLTLYRLEDHQAVRARVDALLGGWPYWCKVEEGAAGELHAHILTVTDAVPGVLAAQVPGLHGVPVWSLRGLLAYLSKPALGGAVRSAHRRAVPLWSQVDAAERYLEARAAAVAGGRKRLPVTSWTGNVPRRQPERKVVPPYLCAALVSLWLAYLQAARQRHRERMQAAMQARRSRPSTFPAGLGHRAATCWPVAGLPVAFRRPLLIGHARPPPRKRPRVLERGSQTRAARIPLGFTPSATRPTEARATAYHRRGPDEAATKRGKRCLRHS